MFFETKLKYSKTLEEGVTKKVTETYLVEAESVTEAETTILSEMAAFGEDLKVSSSKETKYTEIMGTDKDKYFLAKVALVTVDEKSGVEKKSMTSILVNAEDFDGAYKGLQEGMKGTMSDWELSALSETTILDFFKKKV